MRSSCIHRPLRRTSFFIGVLALCAGSVVAGNRQSSVTPADLRCEYLSDPLGIDVRQPGLSWKLIAVDPMSRGQKQTAYQVLAATDKALLDNDKGDLWDCGMVSSDQSVHVVYADQPLAKANGVWRIAPGHSLVVLELQPGSYEFKSSQAIPRKL